MALTSEQLQQQMIQQAQQLGVTGLTFDPTVTFSPRKVIDFNPLEYTAADGWTRKIRWFNPSPEYLQQFVRDYGCMMREYWAEVNKHVEPKPTFAIDLAGFLVDWAQAKFIVVDVYAPDGTLAGFVLGRWDRIMFSNDFCVRFDAMFIKPDYRTPTIYTGAKEWMYKLKEYLGVKQIWMTVNTRREKHIESLFDAKHLYSVYQIEV